MGKVPIGGGGCTPTVEVFLTGSSGAKTETEGLKPDFVVEGQTCFGGCYDFCCDTTFNVSSEAGKGGDLAKIIKQKPTDCETCCRACCSTADIYNLHMEAPMTPDRKAMLIGEMVHLDYMFFERDNFPCTVERQGDTNWVSCLLCLCYCYGCLCPCRLSIPCQEKGSD